MKILAIDPGSDAIPALFDGIIRHIQEIESLAAVRYRNYASVSAFALEISVRAAGLVGDLEAIRAEYERLERKAEGK